VRIVGSRTNFILTVFIVCLGDSEIELDRGPIRKALQVALGRNRHWSKGQYPPSQKYKRMRPSQKDQKIINLNRFSKEMRYHHVYSAIDSSFVSSVRPDLASRIDPNGYGTGP
jgi:hypothetical protein